LILARFYDLPADGAQLRHQFAQSGQVLSDTDLLRAAKHLGLKAGVQTAHWSKLAGIPLPALAKRTDGRYVVLAKIESSSKIPPKRVRWCSLENNSNRLGRGNYYCSPSEPTCVFKI
jgi:subfamily B ATP-binding cassette protein HlyB/CyaB